MIGQSVIAMSTSVATQRSLFALLPAFIVRKVLSAPSDEERENLAKEVSTWKTFDLHAFERIQKIALEMTIAGDLSNARVLLEWHQRLMLECCTGHSLKEGLAEYYAERTVPDPEIVTLEQEHSIDIATQLPGQSMHRHEMVKALVNVVGEEPVRQAHSGSIELLNASVKAKYGADAFYRLMLYADFGEWHRVFALLNSRTDA